MFCLVGRMCLLSCSSITCRIFEGSSCLLSSHFQCFPLEGHMTGEMLRPVFAEDRGMASARGNRGVCGGLCRRYACFCA